MMHSTKELVAIWVVLLVLHAIAPSMDRNWIAFAFLSGLRFVVYRPGTKDAANFISAVIGFLTLATLLQVIFWR